MLDAIDIAVEPGAVHALVGPNGSGKTTALRALAGTLALDTGRVELDGVDVTATPVARRVELGIARTLQSTAIFDALTALENVVVGSPRAAATAASSARSWRPRCTAPRHVCCARAR